MIIINTKRLTISPMTENEITDLINEYKGCVPELSAAYQEMLDGCIANPKQYEWYCVWKISLRTNQKQVGDACFKGFNNGSPEIGYGINDEYCGMGYATEAVTALCEWAFSVPKVISVEAETDADNEKSKQVLSKVGFIPTGKIGAEGPRYILSLSALPTLSRVRFDITENVRLTDENAIAIIKKKCNLKNVQEIKEFPAEKRDNLLKILKGEGLSIRQISRLTGINRGVVLKA